MPIIFSSTQDFLIFLLQALLVLIALGAAWMFSRYLRMAQGQNRLAAARQLADVAVDYAESLAGQGNLEALPAANSAARKRGLAAEWLRGELGAQGVAISEAQAQTWVAAAYHQRAGGPPPAEKIAALAHTAVDLAQRLNQSRLVEIPPGANAAMFLAAMAADCLMTDAVKLGLTLTREQALAYVRGDIFYRLQEKLSLAPAEHPLDLIAREALEFVEDLKSNGRMTIQPGTSGSSMDADVALARMITEVTRRGLVVTADQINDALEEALSQSSERFSLTLNEVE